MGRREYCISFHVHWLKACAYLKKPNERPQHVHQLLKPLQHYQHPNISRGGKKLNKNQQLNL